MKSFGLAEMRWILLFLLLVAGLPAHAGWMWLTNASPSLSNGLQAGDSVTDGTLTLTFTNVVASVGGASSVAVDANGIWASDDWSNSLGSIGIIFDLNATIADYSAIHAYAYVSTPTFVISGANGTTGSMSLSAPGITAFDMGTIPVFKAGEIYTLSASFGQIYLTYLNGLNVSVVADTAAAPIPSTLLLLCVGVLGLVHRYRVTAR